MNSSLSQSEFTVSHILKWPYCIVEKNRKKFLKFYADGDYTVGIEVDESKRPKTAKQNLKEYKEYKPTSMQTEGTFVRLPDDAI